jgi:hypothetical protein
MIKMALAGMVILVIGDSHMSARDYLITTLHDALTSEGAVVHSYGFCGAQPEAWVNPTTTSCGRAERHDKGPLVADRAAQAKTWSITDLIDKHHPNLIIVEQADTMAAYGQPTLPQAWIYEQVRALTTRIKSRNVACLWVGPAWGDNGYAYHKANERVKEMSDFLAKSVAPCRYVDSTAFSKPGEWPTTDGQHLTLSGYRAWGKDLSDSVVRLVAQQAIKP